MLIIQILNVTPDFDLDDPGQLCDYEVDVLVTTSPTSLKRIAGGLIKGHRRGDGWRALARRVADQVDQVRNVAPF